MIKIRHAQLDEKKKIYQWLYLSDTTLLHTGPPDYPEIPVPDWKQFQKDFEDFYFLESGQKGSVLIIENDNEEIGCICYACFHLQPGRAELDIWMKERKFCGKGFGPAAIKNLVEYLNKGKGINKFMIRPSEKNERAIKGYENAGFRRVKDKEQTVKNYLLDEYFAEYGSGDYGFDNTAVLIKE